MKKDHSIIYILVKYGLFLWLNLYLIILIFHNPLSAQTPGSLDTSFDIGTGFREGFGEQVFALAQHDGNVLVGGNFKNFNGLAYNGIARLNPDGNLDRSFELGQGFNRPVRAIAVQADGKIIVGGEFTNFNGIACNYIARLNENGSFDDSFNSNIGTGFNDWVRSITIQSDGKIVVGGDFTSFNGVNRNYLARLNTNGSLEALNLPNVFDKPVFSVVLQNDGKIVAGGISEIARINTDGSFDNAFSSNIGTGFGAVIHSIVTDPNTNKISVGGDFSQFNGVFRKNLARLNADGSLDQSFDPGENFDKRVYALGLQTDEKIIVGGDFSNHLIRLNADGQLDNTFNLQSNFISTNNSSLRAIVVNDQIIVGGQFYQFNGTESNGIMRLNPNGSFNSNFGGGVTGSFESSVEGIAIQNDGKIITVGNFRKFNGMPHNGIVRLHTDGSLDSFNAGSGFNAEVSTMAIQPDGKILVGGDFTEFNGMSSNRIARLNIDGSLDISFNPGNGFNGSVEALALQEDGKIIVVGLFDNFNDISRPGIVRLNSEGTLDNTFDSGSGFDASLESIVIQSDNKILVGGFFSKYQDIERNWIARLNENGDLDPSFNPSEEVNFPIGSLLMLPDDKILLGGISNNLVLLNSNGSLDTSFNTNNNFDGNTFSNMRSLLPLADCGIIAGGFFNSANTLGNGIALLNIDGTLNNSFNPGNGFAGENFSSVGALARQSDGKIIVGGFFDSFDNKSQNRIVRLFADNELSPPQGLTTNPLPVNEGIKIDWLPYEDDISVQGFILERSAIDINNFTIIDSILVNQTTYTDRGLNPDTEYFYRLRVFSKCLSSNYSNVSQAISSPIASDLPQQPTGLTITQVSTTRLDLAWQDNSNTEFGFLIYQRQPNADTFEIIDTTSQDANFYASKGLDSATTYSYYVRAYNNSGVSGSSNVVTAATLSMPPLLFTPSALTARAVSSSKIRLNWVDNSDNEDGFVIERVTGNGSNSEIIAFVEKPAYQDTDLRPNTTYFYRVRAFVGSDTSVYSNWNGATTSSDILTALIDPEAKVDLSIYPNPNNGIFFLELPIFNSLEAPILNIYDALGTQIKSISLNPSVKRQAIQLNNLPQGIYHLQLVSSNESIQAKMIKY